MSSNPFPLECKNTEEGQSYFNYVQRKKNLHIVYNVSFVQMFVELRHTIRIK